MALFLAFYPIFTMRIEIDHNAAISQNLKILILKKQFPYSALNSSFIMNSNSLQT